ncbi:DUF3592 domain-containing protein [Pseudaminobacter soli (ex Li et al. 2025)]|uniref:DUF3592 domain-containing protein n=1 Tax=Pseudaminobacter soli (ex Li et al. 2025) TaxID=1295366 RepID=A0A2P7SGB0_9HYPH|nr:DUF3592 domain-containing protein [Mesorhizobium soli]PSJ61500.1 DUF3592 domain-containing protein [Mesorhizobium soli]
MAHPRSRRRKPNKGGMALGRNLMVLGAIVLAFGTYGVFRGAMTLKWPHTAATITSAELLRQRGSTSTQNGIREDSWNTFHVLYRYTVGDQEYVGGGIEPYDYGMQNSAGAVRMAERYPTGSVSNVAYDPRDPAIAYLEPGPSSFASMLAGIGSFIALVGFWVRRKAAAGIGTMNQPGATEDIAKSLSDRNRF